MLAGLGLTAGLVAAVSWPAVNEVRTGRTPQYPELRPLLLRYSAPLVLARAVETVEGLDGWRLVDVDDYTGVVHAESETPIWGFVDDVTIRIAWIGDGTMLDVTSASRVGRTDFGQNARNVERFERALIANLELARPVR